MCYICRHAYALYAAYGTSPRTPYMLHTKCIRTIHAIHFVWSILYAPYKMHTPYILYGAYGDVWRRSVLRTMPYGGVMVHRRFYFF